MCQPPTDCTCRVSALPWRIWHSHAVRHAHVVASCTPTSRNPHANVCGDMRLHWNSPLRLAQRVLAMTRMHPCTSRALWPALLASVLWLAWVLPPGQGTSPTAYSRCRRKSCHLVFKYQLCDPGGLTDGFPPATVGCRRGIISWFLWRSQEKVQKMVLCEQLLRGADSWASAGLGRKLWRYDLRSI